MREERAEKRHSLRVSDCREPLKNEARSVLFKPRRAVFSDGSHLDSAAEDLFEQPSEFE